MSPPLIALYVVWTAWGVSWIAAALWADRAAARPPLRRELRYRVLTFAGWVLLLGVFVRFRTRDGTIIDPAGPAAWTLPPAAQWGCVALLAAGMAFAWWARIHLGRLWSASVTRKEGHHIVDTGPYGLVRHPIYTGLLSGGIATALLRGNWSAIVGAVLFILGYVMKARIEERFLRESLGRAAYDGYAARVPMLVPFAPA